MKNWSSVCVCRVGFICQTHVNVCVCPCVYVCTRVRACVLCEPLRACALALASICLLDESGGVLHTRARTHTQSVFLKFVVLFYFEVLTRIAVPSSGRKWSGQEPNQNCVPLATRATFLYFLTRARKTPWHVKFNFNAVVYFVFKAGPTPLRLF